MTFANRKPDVFRRSDALVCAVRQKAPRLYIVAQVGGQKIVFQVLFQLRVGDRRYYLDPAVQIARHPIRAAHIDLVVTAVSKIIDPAMFEQTADDAADLDIFGKSGHAGAQHAYAADDQVDLDAGARSLVKRVNYLRIGQAVHLGDDPRRVPSSAFFGLAADHLDHPFAQVYRRYEQLFKIVAAANRR